MADGVLDSVILQINGGENEPDKLYDRELYVDKDNYLWRGKSVENDKPGDAVPVKSKAAYVAYRIKGKGFTLVRKDDGDSNIAGLTIGSDSLVGNEAKKTTVENVDVKNSTFEGSSVKSDKVILTNLSYGDDLPTDGEVGQLFFLADTSKN